MKEEKKELKENFFKKVGLSITKIEKYPDMAAEGVGRAIIYMLQIVAILAIVLCLGVIYQINKDIKLGVKYIENEVPDFFYKDGILSFESDDILTLQPQGNEIDKIIIDTVNEEENKKNEYINSIKNTESGMVILKNEVIIKSGLVSGTLTYNYKDMFNQINIMEFNKKSVVEYVNSFKIINVYICIFAIILMYSFIMFLLTTLSNALILSFIGYLTTIISKIRMRYVAIFNMSVYALTLSILLNVIYIGVNIFITFDIEYFQVMYMTVAAIYLIAAIFILKAEFIKKQIELMKKAEEMKEEKMEKEQEDKEKEEEEKEENNKDDKKDEKNENDNQEPEGSNA